jgi:putative endonuclease
MTKSGRVGAERFGRWAEAACRLALRFKGYRVVAARARTPVGEIDIVAVRGDSVAIVEVKARRESQLAAAALSERQCQRLVRAAAVFLARHPEWTGRSVRFDVMLVAPWRWPHHLPDAWRP